HGYFGVDYTLIWTAIHNEIPKIKIELKRVLREVETEK
ncbi:MAG: HepT-like ribonuclease domain-containing protein, partial [Candidatus Heimdallarchaeaceae archaeon]